MPEYKQINKLTFNENKTILFQDYYFYKNNVLLAHYQKIYSTEKDIKFVQKHNYERNFILEKERYLKLAIKQLRDMNFKQMEV
jgi:hypothetical protein